MDNTNTHKKGDTMSSSKYALKRDSETGQYYLMDRETGENAFGLMSLREARALLDAED